MPSPDSLAELVKLVDAGTITRDQGREVLVESVETGRTPAEIVTEHGFTQMSDESDLRLLAQAAIDANPKAASDYRAGKKQAIAALMADLRKRAPHANLDAWTKRLHERPAYKAALEKGGAYGLAR